MNEFVEQFLLESRDLVAQAVDDLMALEENPDDRERLDGVFRAFHTLKGAAGIVEFAAMARTLHAAEEILAKLRSSAEPIASDTLDECLASLDLTSRWLDAMQANGDAPLAAEAEADDMIARLIGSMEATNGENVTSPSPPAGDWLDRLQAVAGDQLSGALTAVRFVPDQQAFFRGDDPLAIIASLPKLLMVDFSLTDQSVSLDTLNTFSCSLEILALTKSPAAQVGKALSGFAHWAEIRELSPQVVFREDEDNGARAKVLLRAQIELLREEASEGLSGRLASAGRTAANALRSIGRSESASEIDLAMIDAEAGRKPASLVAAIERALKVEKPAGLPIDSTSLLAASPRALRVDMDRIDALVNLTGELLVVKNAIGHLSKRFEDNEDLATIVSALRDQHALFDRLATELQGAVLRTRVLPLRTVFRRFPRLVREIAGSLGKTVRLITEGEGTEADATIVDGLFEPLLHVLRNAVDHGIESPDRRASVGKPAMGTIIVRGFRNASNVVIEVEDDGDGIDVARVRAVAGARGIASQDILAIMTDGEVIDLIFAAGFSTAAAVTDLSGRGVGMDSVRTAAERLGGKVVLGSRPGSGTVVSLSLPFSLMMTRVMTVEVGGQAFGVPLDNVLETAILDRNMVMPIGSGHAFVLRNRTIPLIDLAGALGFARDTGSLKAAKIVVVSTAGQIGALEVDRLGERMEVMLKPMEGLLGGMRSVAGTTLLGDGRVLVVLDVEELFH